MIPQAPEERKKLVETVVKRYSHSRRWFSRWHERWVRYYKIWRSLQESVEDLEDAEEPNTFVPYAWGMVEDLHAKAVEPILKMGLPCKPQPKIPGDGEAAKNMGFIARAHFTSSDFQLEFMPAGKSRIVTGNMWEKDVWCDDWTSGQRWAKVERPTVVQVLMNIAGKIAPQLTETMVKKWELVEDRYPVRTGYRTEFPSEFLIHPEPGVKNVKDLQWLIEEEPSVALKDLEAKVFTDPQTGQQMPVYDLTELRKEEGQGKAPGQIRPANPDSSGVDYYGQVIALLAGDAKEKGASESDDGIDRVHLLHMHLPDGQIITVAQGKYVIRVVKQFLARIHFRNRVYTVDPHFLLGIGAIEPVEDVIFELNDIHNLSMANWVRIINRMVGVNADALVDEKELEPGPRKFMRFHGSVHQAIKEMNVEDVAPSMLAMESNSKGIIEHATASADLAPGLKGTKQAHDTATGVLEIQRNMIYRLSMMRRVDLANFQDQIWVMEKMYSFYQFKPAMFPAFDDEGRISTVELNNESIYTDGRGFHYLIEYDPSFGDTIVERNQLMTFWKVGMEYEQWRMSIGGPAAPSLQVPNLFRRISKNFGFEDTTFVLKHTGGVLDPKMELQLILSGAQVQVNGQEDLIGHFLEHLTQRNGQEFIEGMTSGKIPPAAIEELDRHIAETLRAINLIMQDPMKVAEMKKQQQLMTQAMPNAKTPQAQPA